MKVHTSEFKEEINKMGRQINGKIYYSVNYNLASESDDLLITENNLNLVSEQINGEEVFEISNEDIFSMSFINNGNIFQSLMKEFDFESNIELQVGTKVNPQFGVLVDDEYEYLDYGNFIIKSREYNLDTETWSYVCYDKMMLFMIDYKPLDITYPITIKNFLLKICERIGVNFEYQTINDMTWHPDTEGTIIYAELFENKGYTYRDVLDKIAEIYGGNLLINKNDNLSIYALFPFPTEERYADTFDESFLKDSKSSFNQKVGPINRIVIVDSENNLEYPSVISFPDETYTDVNELRIVDNEFALNGNASSIATSLLAQLVGLEYYYCDFTTTGICYLDYLDRFLITRRGVNYPCLLLNNEITITQGIEETIFTDESPQAKAGGNEYTTSIMDSKETSFKVNKQTNEINSKVSKDGVISAINQSAEQIQIQANKISLEGKEINLTSENIEIYSEVHDKYTYTNNDLTVLSNIISTGRTPTSEELDKYDLNHDGILTAEDLLWVQSKVYGYAPTGGTFKITGRDAQNIITTTSNTSAITTRTTKIGLENLETHSAVFNHLSCFQSISLISNSEYKIVLNASSGNVKCVSLTQTSKAEEKKNFEKLKNAKDILKQVDIYKYNFKSEDDNVKKSIGFVIGDDFNYSKEITSKNNDGVNVYSMVSVLWQVVKEQQEEIEELKEMIRNGKY